MASVLGIARNDLAGKTKLTRILDMCNRCCDKLSLFHVGFAFLRYL